DARTQWFVVPVSGPATALAFDYNDLDAASPPRPHILRGAATSVAYSPGPPKIIATSPAPGASLVASPSLNQLTVTFHTNVNPAATAFRLVGASTGVRTFSLASGAGVNPAVLNLDAPLPADTYTLTVQASLTAADSGMALDGEIVNPTSPASLPSGNGVA